MLIHGGSSRVIAWRCSPVVCLQGRIQTRELRFLHVLNDACSDPVHAFYQPDECLHLVLQCSDPDGVVAAWQQGHSDHHLHQYLRGGPAMWTVATGVNAGNALTRAKSA